MNMATVPLGEIAKVQTGKLDANASSDTGKYPFFTCAREPLKIDNWKYDLDAILVAGNGDLNVKHYKGKFEAYQRTYIVNVADTDRLDSRYLFHFMDTYVERLREQSIGGIIKYIKLGMLTEAPIPLPPLKEQRRIAGILDQADALRRLRARARDKLNTLGQAIFYEMFGSPVYAGDVSLSDVLLASGNGLQVDQDERGEGLPVTRIETIWNGEIDPRRVKWSSPDMARAERFLLRPGDILFSHINSPEHIAKTAIYEGHPDQLLHGINLLRLQPDREMVNSYWLITFLKTEPVRRFFRARCKKAVNQASLNQKNLSELTFALPNFEAQMLFAERLATVAEQFPAYTSSSQKFESLFAVLQSRAFRGEL